jgi:hypothetical protein
MKIYCRELRCMPHSVSDHQGCTRFTCFGYLWVVDMAPVERASILRERLFPCYARSHSHKKHLLASACLSVCPSVRMYHCGSHWTYFHEI